MTFERESFFSGQSGMSLVGVMIAAAIMGAIALGINQVIVNGMKASQSVGLKSDLNTTRDYLYANLNCAKTLPTAIRNQCSSSKEKIYVDLRWRDGKVLLAKNSSQPAFGSTLGDWWVRASCSSDEKLTIERKRGTVTGKGKDIKQTTSLDPLSGRATDWEDLFPGMQLCHEVFMSNSSTPELAHDNTHLEFYPTGRFKAVGGDMRVEIKRLPSKAGCIHNLLINGNKVLDNKAAKSTYSFETKQDVPFSFEFEVVSVNNLCKGFKTQNGMASGVAMSKVGMNIWKILIEDALLETEDKVHVTWDDSIWTITGTPL